MKKFSSFLIAAMLLISVFNLNAKTMLEFTSGMRIDYYSWNIAGNREGAGPNVLSDLSWSNMVSLPLSLSYYSNLNFFLLSISLEGDICGFGINRDSDYTMDNREQESSRSINKVNGSTFLNSRITLGYILTPGQTGWLVMPFIGALYTTANLRLYDGTQVIPAESFLPALDSCYQPRWFCIGGGLEISFPLVHRISVTLLFSYYFADFYAKADWNLRDDFAHPVSFEHLSRGYIVDTGGRLTFPLTDTLVFVLSADYRQSHGNPGIESTYLTDGRILQTKLNEVNAKSLIIGMGIKLEF